MEGNYMARNYLITRKNYYANEFSGLFTAKSKRIKAISECNNDMNNYFKTKNVTYFNDEDVLILWEDFEDEKTAVKKWGYSEEELIYSFCEEIKLHGNILSNLYIESPFDLKKKEENLFVVLDRILHIWKTTEIIPVFLKNNFLTKSSADDVSVDIGEPIVEESDVLTRAYAIIHEVELEVETKRAIEEIDHDYFSRFFTSIETLITLANLPKPIKKINEDEDCEPFLVQYFKWQTKEITGQEAFQHTKSVFTEPKNKSVPKKTDEGVSPSTFYRHQEKFEASPYYPEWMNAHRRFFIKEGIPEKEPRERVVEKSANLPDNIWFISNYWKISKKIKSYGTPLYYEMYAGFENSTNKEDKKESAKINSVVDVPRIFKACNKTVHDDHHKSKLKPELEKRGLTLEDVGIKTTYNKKTN